MFRENIWSNTLPNRCLLLNSCILYVSAATGRGGAAKKKTLDVETDAAVLCTRLCGGNYYKEGEDPVLGKDEDYPDWLWKLHLERGGIPLEELSQDDPRYWKRLKVLTLREKNKVRANNKF